MPKKSVQGLPLGRAWGRVHTRGSLDFHLYHLESSKYQAGITYSKFFKNEDFCQGNTEEY